MIELMSGWNVLRTRSRQEKMVERSLMQKQVPVYLPKLRRMNRKLTVETPLFPGYVFVKPNAEQLYSMNFIPGSCGLIMHRGRPGTLRERELISIRKIVSTKLPIETHLGLLPGTMVRVTGGPLVGVEGVLLRYKNGQRLVINTSILGQAVSVEINAFETVAI
jgi:transcription termination/antitermination protein NusG